jgi:hypothetical protein
MVHQQHQQQQRRQQQRQRCLAAKHVGASAEATAAPAAGLHLPAAAAPLLLVFLQGPQRLLHTLLHCFINLRCRRCCWWRRAREWGRRPHWQWGRRRLPQLGKAKRWIFPAPLLVLLLRRQLVRLLCLLLRLLLPCLLLLVCRGSCLLLQPGDHIARSKRQALSHS